MYTVKSVKTFHGHDGYGWECKLYNSANKAVAVVVEDGYGGDLQFHWTDDEAPRVESPGVDWKGNPHTFIDTPHESDLRAFCLTLPKWECGGEMVNTDWDIYLGNLVNAALTLKDVKKLLRKVAITDGENIFTYNCKPDHPTVRDTIAKKHPDAVVLNDMPLNEAVDYYMAVTS